MLLTAELGSPPNADVAALATRLRQESAHEPAANATAGAQEPMRPIEHGTNDAEAYELYLQARHHWKLRTREGFQSARKYYEAAADRDPGFARAWAGLAAVYVNLSNFGYMNPGEGVALAERSAERAIELDSTLAEAHAARGFVRMSRLEFEQSEEAFRRAVTLNPDYSFGHHYYTLLLLMLGRTSEALEKNREALRADPLSRAANATTGIVLCQRGDFDGAARELERALALAPEFPLTLCYLGVVRVAQRAWDEALALLERCAQLAPGFTGAPGARTYLYGRAGRHAEAESILDRLRADAHDERARANLALALGVLGSLDEAFALMDGLRWDVPSLISLRADPLLRGLRADRRYKRLLHSIGADAAPAKAR